MGKRREVTEARLAHLKALASPHQLAPGEMQVGGAALEQLNAMPKLSAHLLRRFQATNAQLNELKRARPGLEIYQ
jgi:hypothetical protein